VVITFNKPVGWASPIKEDTKPYILQRLFGVGQCPTYNAVGVGWRLLSLGGNQVIL